MTGPEHYREAERIFAAVASARTRSDGDLTETLDAEAEQALPFGLWSLNLAAAQVHATLALAAASVVGPLTASRSVATDGLDQWQQAAGLEVKRW